MTLCYTTTKANKHLLEAINTQISNNLELANSAGTLTWDTVKEAANDDVAYIFKPPVGFQNPGCPYFTQADMLANVNLTGVTEQNFNPDWLGEGDA